MHRCWWTRRRALSAAAGVVAAAAIAWSVPFGQASADSTAVSGKFTSEPVTGPECPSPNGLCWRGVFTGKIKGSFLFSASSVTASFDTPTTGVVLYTGDLSVQTGNGTFVCKDAGVLRNSGPRPLSSVCVVVSGTGAFAGASGYLQFRGSAAVEGEASGDFVGEIVPA